MIDEDRMARLMVNAANNISAELVCRDDEEREFYASLVGEVREILDSGNAVMPPH